MKAEQQKFKIAQAKGVNNDSINTFKVPMSGSQPDFPTTIVASLEEESEKFRGKHNKFNFNYTKRTIQKINIKQNNLQIF